MQKKLPRFRAFTLVELLVVIFVIAVLITLLLGAVNVAQKRSRVAKTRADMSAISMALEQYHSDFRTYPIPDMQHTILAQALIGPGPAAQDGADGPGFRTPDLSTNPPTFNPNSKKWDAYLSPEHFKVQQFANGWAILDYFGNPIRYYPKRRNLNPTAVNPAATPPTMMVGSGNLCIFDYLDGEHPQLGCGQPQIDQHFVLSAETLAKYLGDNNGSNVIEPDETFHLQSEFILASSGPDGLFTKINEDPKLNRSDDILNFDYK